MINIRVLNPHTAVEISGVDVKTLDDQSFAPIYDAWLKHGVLCVRDQELTIPDFLEYSRRFGYVVPHPSKSTRNAEFPEITMLGIDKFDADGKLIRAVYARGGESFHTDGAYDEVPFKATQLFAVAIPSRGGDTQFSSMYAAYDALPQGLKDRLADKRGEFRYGGTRESNALLNPEDRGAPSAFHKLVNVHPETGRKSLYFDPGKIVCVEGVSEIESDALIQELTERMIAPEARYDHKWQVGDIVIWDNRCMVHKAAGDYPPEEDRIHWRVSIKDSLEGARVAA